MDCYVCGNPLPERANFCPNCGWKLPTSPVTPEAELADPVPEEEIVPVAEEPDSPEPQPEAPDPPLSEEPPTTEEAAPTVPEPVIEKRRPMLLPCLIMTTMFLVGFICFLLFPFASDSSADPTTPVIQDQQTPAGPDSPTLPVQGSQSTLGTARSNEFVPADESCFEFTGGAIRFLPDKYDGGRVLVIPNEIGGRTVTAIADYGFANCDGITTIILPDGLKTIGSYAFNGCDDLRGIFFPDSLQKIGKGAFNWCVSLEAVSVPTSVKTIEPYAFSGCASLMYVFYSGTYSEWSSLYNEYITPFTWVICLDGDYYQGEYIP